jgi:serine/threonine protein kinase
MLCCLNPNCPNPENPDGNNLCHSCGTPLIPLLRSRYRVTKRLSDEGGFGITYLAEDIDKLNEYCVVKQLAPKVQEPWAVNKAIQLFKEEAKRLQQLGEHSQIPTLLAYFEQDHYMYLVQQFIEGQNLSKELQQRGTYSESEIHKLLLDLLPVLQFIHKRGVIHRDIKPQNIMRCQSDGKLVLIDFGASKQLTATVHTKIGTNIGSHGYCPLEQMQDGEAYPASDLFSLGATCFHLLTGVRPFQLWTEHGYSWVTSWRQYLKSPIRSDLGEILDKLLKKNFNERYQSADQVMQDLTSGQLSAQPPLQKQNTKLRNGLLGGAVILLLGLGGIWYWQFRPPVTNDYSSQLKTLDGHSNLVTSVAISPDGTILASASVDGMLKLWNLVTSREIRTLDANSGSLYAVTITSDGKTLASGNGQKTIQLWNLATGQQIRTLKGHTSSIKSVAITPNGQILVSGSFDGSIKLWNMTTGKAIRTLQGHSQEVKSVAISSNGQTLASGSADDSIKLWNLITGQEVRTLLGHFSSVNSVAISPDGVTLASGSVDKSIKLWNLATGKEIRTLRGHSYAVNTICFSTDGKILASGGADNTIKLWELSTGKEIRILQGHTKEVTSVAINPNGKTLASGSVDGTIRIWRLSP